MSGYPDYPAGPGPGSGGYTPYGGPQDYAATPSEVRPRASSRLSRRLARARMLLEIQIIV